MSGRAGGLADAARLAFGTLTVLPVRAPRVDRETAGRAMVLAPVVGLVFGGMAAVGLEAFSLVGLSPLTAAVVVVALLAAATRAVHLDGLADTADGLGSGRPPQGALEVMRRGDIGPFGVVTLLLVLGLQVAALAELLVWGRGGLSVGIALVASRLMLPLACSAGIPSARPDGLGAAVVGSVSRIGALVAVLLALVSFALLGTLGNALTHLLDTGTVLTAVALAPLGLVAGAVVCWHAVRRLGGLTGDVLGAAVELTFTATLLLLCLLP